MKERIVWLTIMVIGLAAVAQGQMGFGTPPGGWLYRFDGDADLIENTDGWHDDNDQWDGSAPGSGKPGGMEYQIDPVDGTTYLRHQDTGDPRLAMLETNFVSTTSNIAFRRELIAAHGLSFQPLRYTHDWDFILSACAHGAMDVVEEPLVSYRVHGANTIREGQEEDLGTGQMRFEIMWSVVRHAQETCRLAVQQGHDAEDLRGRMWRSLPRFGCESILSQLLILRGEGPVPPAAYDDLLRPDHPFRVAAIEVLAQSDRPVAKGRA